MICAHRSPSVWSGVRTAARSSLISVASGLPSTSSFITGMWKPSSNTSRGSTERTLPPMSGACAVEAAKATMRPLRKIGLATVMSLRWPVAIHGVLVTSTSPGRILARPICLMNSFTVTGSVPMNDGMLSVFCASDCPAASVSTQAKSLHSFTSVENDVRLSAFAASSTAEIVRRHRISSVRRRRGGWLMARDGCDMRSTKQSLPAWSTFGSAYLQSSTPAYRPQRWLVAHMDSYSDAIM